MTVGPVAVDDGIPGGLFGMATALVAIPSVSHVEGPMADAVEAALRLCPWLSVERVGDNVVARTDLGRGQRVLLAGHLDTVPPTGGNEEPRIEGETLYGVGAADMKGGVAVFLHLAGTIPEPSVDVTWCFYACEEVSREFNGLRQLWDQRPELLVADAAILGEPTGGVVEAGCQGTLRVRISLEGRRAHTARPHTGRNAIHRLSPLLATVTGYRGRRPVLDGCEYVEQLQVVEVSGGVSGNVVPDEASLLINHRFAPDRTPEQAESSLRELLGPHLEQGDRCGGCPLRLSGHGRICRSADHPRAGSTPAARHFRSAAEVSLRARGRGRRSCSTPATIRTVQVPGVPRCRAPS